MKKIVFAFFTVIFLISCKKNNSTQKEDEILKTISVKYVSSKEGLNVRESPTLDSEKIAALIYSSEVKVLEVGAEENIDGINANWVRVQIPMLSWGQKEKTGWVFGGYLSEKLDSPFIIRYNDFKEIDKTYNDYNIKISRDRTSKNIIILKEGKEIFKKNISSYCYNNAKDKIYFYSEENYIKGKMVWEMKDRHYSFYELNLNDFSVTELFQNTTTEGGYGLRLSADDKYLCYPESGGEMVGDYSPKYFQSYGIGGIYNLETKKTVFTKEYTNFYPIGNGYFLGKEPFSNYSLFDKDLNYIQDIDIFELANTWPSEEYYFPEFSLICHSLYPFFFVFSTKDNNYRIIINNSEIFCEKIEDCNYETFIEINNIVYCLLVQNQNLNIYDKEFNKINSIKCPVIPQNMEICFIDYENGQIIINIDLIAK